MVVTDSQCRTDSALGSGTCIDGPRAASHGSFPVLDWCAGVLPVRPGACLGLPMLIWLVDREQVRSVTVVVYENRCYVKTDEQHNLLDIKVLSYSSANNPKRGQCGASRVGRVTSSL